jgi:hypothetical protein
MAMKCGLAAYGFRPGGQYVPVGVMGTCRSKQRSRASSIAIILFVVSSIFLESIISISQGADSAPIPAGNSYEYYFVLVGFHCNQVVIKE